VTASTDDTRWLIDVGAQLRAARLEQAITLETVAQVTRISKSQLEAIEEGAVARLPAMAYVRGFVRIYGSYLGVSSDCLMPKSESLSPQSYEQEAPDSSARKRGGSSRGRRWFAPLTIGAAVLALAYCYQRVDSPQRPIPDQPAQAVAPLKPVQSAVSTVRPTAVSQQPPAPPAVPETPVAPVDGAILRLKVNQDCWLNITIDGAFSQQYDLKAGDLIEWKAEDSIALDLGNAGGVEAQFNGKTLAPFGESGRVAHIVLKAEPGSETSPTRH